MPKLTATLVRDLPLTSGGQRFIVDDALPGFGVRVGKTAKSFYAESRVRGKPRRVTLGRTDKIALADARRLAKLALAEMAGGTDRNAEMRAERAKTLTLGEAVEGWLEERTHRPSTVRGYRGAMTRDFGDWHDKQLRHITPNMYLARFKEMMARSESGAMHSTRAFKSMWTWARADAVDKDGNPILGECPAQIVARKKLAPKPKRKQGYVADWPAFWKAVQGIQTSSNRHKDAGDKLRVFLELVARTGLRMSEAAHLRWAEVDLDRATLTIIAERSKNGEPLILPLSTQTTELLKAQWELTGSLEYVWGDKHYGDPRKSLGAFRERLGWNMGFHDLRRSFSVVATRLDINQAKIARLLNHKANGVTHGYQILSDPELLRDATQRISDAMDTIEAA